MELSYDLKELEQETRQLGNKFLQIVEPYRSDLWRYCQMLTRSPWDAEDLVQETLLKAFASLGQLFQPLMPKSYLFRIATNTWINQSRRIRNVAAPLSEDLNPEDTSASSPFEVQEAIELLLSQLPSRQAVVILLMDVFEFTAKETAEMIATTEGAVKAALHRARAALKKLSSAKKQGQLETDKPQSNESKEKSSRIPDSKVVDAYIDAFHRRDPAAMASLFAEHAHNDIVHVGQEYGHEEISRNSIQDTFRFWPNNLRAEYQILWGLPVIVVLMETSIGMQLKSIIYVETQDEQIVYKKEYYFCADLLEKAGKHLGVPVHER